MTKTGDALYQAIMEAQKQTEKPAPVVPESNLALIRNELAIARFALKTAVEAMRRLETAFGDQL